MGEAWFMSAERRIYPELLGDLQAIPVERLQDTLYEIAVGTHSFGPQKEWQSWFRYLLPRLIPRSHETHIDALLDTLITAFFTQHPKGLDEEPYPGFRADALLTLGRCLMDHVCWPDGDLDVGMCLNKSYFKPTGLWWWDQASEKLSASLFFCLKYLRPAQIGPWMDSVLGISSPYWRAQVMIWLLGAHGVLTGAVKQPSEFSYDDYPRIDWAVSYCLSGEYTGIYDGSGERAEFIPLANRLAALESVTSYFSEDVFLEWLETITQQPSLVAELADAHYSFYSLYGTKNLT